MEILSYVAKGPVAVSKKIVQEVLHRLDPSRKEQIMESFGQEYFDRGFAEGEAKGKATGEAQGEARGEARGEAKGLAAALIRLLAKRFDPLPPQVSDRIYGANVTSIENWLDVALDALDLQSIFGAEARSWSRPRERETH